MITINLLPDSRLARIKAAKRQRSISAFTVLAIVAGLAVPIILLIVWLGQRGILALTQRSIDDKIGQLQAVENIDNILTTQSQLNGLPPLNQQRLFHSKFLNLLPKLLPEKINLTAINVAESGTVTLSGDAPSSSLIQDFVAILGRCELFSGESARPAFSSVTAGSITPSSEGGAAFEISFTSDSALFTESFPEGVRVASKVIKEPVVVTPPAPATPTPETQPNAVPQ